MTRQFVNAGVSTTDAAAIAAVAAASGAIWDGRSLTLSGRPIAVEVAAISEKATFRSSPRPRLRFDKVVRQLFDDLRADLAAFVPAGEAVSITVTAPVRLGGKTAVAIADRIRAGLKSGTVRAEIHGNRVCLQRLLDVPPQMPKVIGFVHNPETDPAPLLNLIQQLVRQIHAVSSGRRTSRERWLILDGRKGHAHIETYRQIWGRIAIPTGFARILVVLADGKVQSLTA